MVGDPMAQPGNGGGHPGRDRHERLAAVTRFSPLIDTPSTVKVAANACPSPPSTAVLHRASSCWIATMSSVALMPRRWLPRAASGDAG